MTRPMHEDAAASFLLKTMELLLLLLMFSSVAAECPYKCRCYKETSKRVDCGYGELYRIPDLISMDTTVLDLRFNKIRDIEPKSLTYLTELNTLDLSNNIISDLKNGAFANLSKLRTLYLDDNNIENIETKVFNNLTLLEELYLRSNSIHTLDSKMFKGLTKLKALSLNYNMISNIPPGIFDSLTSLRKLWINYNQIKCDCYTLMFVNMLKKSQPPRDVLKGTTLLCSYPGERGLKSLVELTENDLRCTSPDVIEVPENKTVLVGDQLQLSCKAVGNPEPFITWAKDDIDLEPGQRFQVFQDNTLIISKVEITDGGQYKCVASNSLGRKSFEAMVNVNGNINISCILQ
ncbi:unnamed protein product [Macrosiphum euphorbiae]|uniref:Ig-like domain-containing protein n=1 Tax=Macrosiphum euphorbiae TaxID=13131 RepID=A0AAV0VKY0_9HEMI|nr:unnamed protein product [Macrosiphum euphorbiae]